MAGAGAVCSCGDSVWGKQQERASLQRTLCLASGVVTASGFGGIRGRNPESRVDNGEQRVWALQASSGAFVLPCDWVSWPQGSHGPGVGKLTFLHPVQLNFGEEIMFV